jgi:hypothetical protein
MSLLSRTLQSILSKYILDVDVEGIALPSLFVSPMSSGNSTNQSGSHKSTTASGNNGSTNAAANDGWGVRLSNVKLREGVQLMQLPGKMRRGNNKKKTHQQKQRRTNRNKSINATTKSDNLVESNVKNYEATLPEIESTSSGMSNCKNETTFPSQTMYHSKPLVETVSDERTECTEEPIYQSTHQNEQTKSTGWFSSWFRTSSVDQNEHVVLDQQSLLEDNHLHDSAFMPPSLSIDNDMAANTGKLEASQYPISSTESEKKGYLNNNSENNVTFYHEESDDENQSTSFADEDEDHRDIDDSENDFDEDERDATANEGPLVLKLGKDGTIGILDVRLVGKTIHILIEDADLTIEVVRQTATITTDSTSNVQNQQQTSKKKTVAADLSPPALKTAGDRVLAENIIARYLSIIPNLFLRDIRIRLIIRDEESVQQQYIDRNDSDNIRLSEDTANRPNDTIVEVLVGLFSVNDGKDFLLNFAGEVDNDDDDIPSSSDDEDEDILLDEEQHRFPGEYTNMDPTTTDLLPSVGEATTTSTITTSTATNEFLTKRIRTGRGPDGGVVVKIYPAIQNYIEKSNASSSNVEWAYDAWNNATEFALLRCSGLDVQAQIFLGTKKEIAINNYGYYAEEMQYDDFTVDAMLFGVDYIVPGPQPPLPKIVSNVQQVLPNPLNADIWANTGVTTFVTDENGIQSCRLASPFHKVARGLVPRHCLGMHLPCESCHQCWTKDGAKASPHILDASTPLGGFIVHISLRDPIDINVNRFSLNVLGRLISIFTKPQEVSDPGNISSNEANLNRSSTTELSLGSQHSVRSHSSAPNVNTTAYASIDDSARSTYSGRRLSRMISGSLPPIKSYDEFSIESAFPTYMKPEKIQMIGFHFVEIRFRVHVMRKDGDMEYGRTFCYWDVLAKCATVDCQILAATERPFQDVRFDIGHLSVHQFKGVDRKQIISLGVRPLSIELDNASVETFVNNETRHKRSPWPTTAAAILDVVPTLESLTYADREYHGLQLRYASVVDQMESVNRSHKDLNIRIGTAFVDLEFKIKNEIMVVIRESILLILGPPKPNPTPVTPIKKTESILKYKVISDGGSVELRPLLSANLPQTISQGEISSKAGFSIESFFNNFQIAYGKPSPIRVLDQGLSLEQLAMLPDNVRLRVLLFLKDLKPLEAALGLPDAPNSFLRCRSVNNGIVQAAERRGADSGTETFSENRRQVLISELLSLDDDTLDHLLSLHRQKVPVEP